MLFVMRKGDAAARYPIAPSRSSQKETDPVWDVPGFDPPRNFPVTGKFPPTRGGITRTHRRNS
jgi:hypothetical protein